MHETLAKLRNNIYESNIFATTCNAWPMSYIIILDIDSNAIIMSSFLKGFITAFRPYKSANNKVIPVHAKRWAKMNSESPTC